MTCREIMPGIQWVGVNDWDRRLFDALIPLPDGTSYNAYLIRGSDKVALIDTVDPTKTEDLLENLRAAGISSLDYVVVSHAEQDHSGAIPRVVEEFPGVKVVTNDKCREFIQSLLHLPDEVFLTIKDGETISLGGRTLEFLVTPWVHWPETMLTYLREEKILFTCDLFGSHLASSDLYAHKKDGVYKAAKRYYAEIMMPFRGSIRKHLERLQGYAIDLIATSHGPIWDDPEFILDAYRGWVTDQVENVVLIPFVSMHGSTRRMVDYLVDGLITRGIRVHPFNLTVTDIGELATALVDAATIVLGTPTVLFNPHPSAVYAAHLTRILKPKTHYVTVIGSYGWGGKTVSVITDMLAGSSMKFLDPVLVKGNPTEDDFRALDALANAIAKRHQEDPLVVKRG